jgi:hypothetical protein
LAPRVAAAAATAAATVVPTAGLFFAQQKEQNSSSAQRSGLTEFSSSHWRRNDVASSSRDLTNIAIVTLSEEVGEEKKKERK